MPIDKEEYKKQLGISGGDTERDYYDDLKSESYKAMLSKEVQASVAADQARKYTNNMLNAQGLASQGVAQSTMSGIGNNYRNALMNAQNEFNQSLTNINQQQRQEQLQTNNSNFESLSALMSGATSQEDLDMILDTYGYKKGDAGWDFSDLDSNSAKQLNTMYNLFSSQLNNNTLPYSYSASGNVGYYDKDGTWKMIDLKDGRVNGWNKENKTLQTLISTKKIDNNTYFALENKGGKDAQGTIYVCYKNGQLLVSTPEEYNKAKNKYYINETKVEKRP